MKIPKNILLILVHCFFWILLASFPFQTNLQWFDWEIAFMRVLFPFLFFISLAYANAFVFIPLFFQQKNFVWYKPLIAYLVVAPISFLLLEYIFTLINYVNDISVTIKVIAIKDGKEMDFGLSNTNFPTSIILGLVLFVLFTSSLYGFTLAFIKKERKEVKLKAINLKNELKLLRSQINPHFLFNALNNLYAIVQMQPEKSGDFILKLSEMLRYVTYDCQHDKVSLNKEVAYINNYIYFQQWRDKKLKNINLEVEKNVLNLQIEPMVLIPFVENAFKHSYSEKKERWISIALKKEKNTLVFVIKNNNSDLETQEKIPDEYMGIGIKNIKKRLELLYPQKHKLTIKAKSDSFHVELMIDLCH